MGVIRILCFDGGGVRGEIPMPSLMALEDLVGPVGEKFHFIAGTSTGGIIATGLSSVKGQPLASARDLDHLYMERCPDIFDDSLRGIFIRAATNVVDGVLSPKNVAQTIVSLIDKFDRANGFLGPKYNPVHLQTEVSSVMGTLSLSNIDGQLMIPSYDLGHRQTNVFKSWVARGEAYDPVDVGETTEQHDVSLYDALMATTAAPSYFPPHLLKNKAGSLSYHVDGGVWANNPSMVALSAARKIFGPSHAYLLVSFGTGETERPVDYRDARRWGKTGWIIPGLDLLQDGSVQSVDYYMRHDPNVDYLRFQTDLRARDTGPTPKDDMDNGSYENMVALKRRGELMLAENKARLEGLARYFNTVPMLSIDELLEETLHHPQQSRHGILEQILRL